MKKKYIRVLFPSLFPKLQVTLGYLYDAYKFGKSNTGVAPSSNETKSIALIIRQTHGIEKGLAIDDMRYGFGEELIKVLCLNIQVHCDKFGWKAEIQSALDVLYKYSMLHKINKFPDNNGIISKIDSTIDLFENYKNLDNGGTYFINRENIYDVVKNIDFESFSSTRFSVRDFSGESVEKELINSAISFSLKTPSACNRQSWRVKVYSEDKINDILSLQNGNRGIIGISKVLLILGVTSNYSTTERHATWVDGGMFSMSILYSLHSLGLGACPLNTSYSLQEELNFRNVAKIELDEEPIMMIAVGKLKPEFKVAKSYRKNIENILSYE